MKQLLTFLLTFFLINAFGQMPNTLSKTEKIYGLSKFWQEVNYNFIYLNKVDREKWDKDYQRLISDVQNTKDDYEYYRLLQKFCATLKDGHTNVFFPREVRDNVYRTYFGDYRLFLKNIDGKAILVRVNESKKEELPIGSEVIKVNGISTKKYIEQFVAPYISSSTDYIVDDNSIRNLLSAPKGTSFELDFKLPSGKVKSMTLTHSETKEEEVYPPMENRELLDFKWMDDDIAYVSLNSFGNPKIDTLFIEKLPELYRAKKLVIDLRFNGGGSTSVGREIIQYLTNDTILFGSRNFSRLHIPSFKAWGSWTEAKDTINDTWAKQSYLSFRDEYYHEFPHYSDTVRLNERRVVVPTAILIGHNTASAAEDFLIYADKLQNMTKIGEPTYGSTGQPMLFDLPGGGSARICTKRDTYPDGREFVGYGIQPDIKVRPTLQDYLNDNDPVLKQAIKFLKSKNDG